MKTYQLRVSIMGIPKLYRLIEISENCTFDDLHDAIFKAFDRYNEHLYSFFITRKDAKSTRTIYNNAPQITHPVTVEEMGGYGERTKSTAETRIGDVDLNEKDILHYLFDFGDDWWHRIRVQKINETKTEKQHVKLIKSVGESPPQYPDYDDYDEE